MNSRDTELAQLRMRVAQLERLHGHLFDRTGLGVATLGLDGRFLKVNHALCDFFDRSAEDLQTKTLQNLTHVEDLRFGGQLLRELREGERQQLPLDMRFLRPDKTFVWASVSGALIADARGDAAHYLVQLNDISAYRAAQEGLLRSSQLLAKAQRIARVGHWYMDPHTERSEVSDEFLRIFGFEPEPGKIRTKQEIDARVHPEDRDRALREIELGIKLGRPWDVEHRIVLPDGTLKHVRCTGEMLLDARGRPERIFSTVQDISEPKRIEEELRRTKMLEGLGLLAGGIAHDFNNMLTGVSANIGLIEYELSHNQELAEVPAVGELHNALSDAIEAIRSTGGVVRQLMTFARGGAPTFTIASIRDILVDTVALCLRRSDTRVEFRLSEELWPIEADVSQMTQVIQNLVRNGEQAMSEAGTLTIEGENVVLEAQNSLDLPAGPYVQVRVRDQGVGIAQDDLRDIFAPYYSTTDAGLGLGLAIVHSVIDQHGGHVEVVSTPGEGSTFTLWVRALPGDARRRRPGMSAASVFQNGQTPMRILVMDDNKLVRRALARTLRRLGHQVELCNDGESVISAYRFALEHELDFDLVIMDLTIPGGMGGKQAAAELLRIDPEAKMIVASGYSDDAVMATFEQHGFCCALQKPIHLKSLTQALERVPKKGH